MRKYVLSCLATSLIGLTALPITAFAQTTSQPDVHHHGGSSQVPVKDEKSITLHVSQMNGRMYINGKANQLTVCIPSSSQLRLTVQNRSGDVVHVVEVRRQHTEQKPMKIRAVPENPTLHGNHLEVKPYSGQTFLMENLDLGKYTLVLQGDDGQTDKYLVHVAVSPATSHVVFL